MTAKSPDRGARRPAFYCTVTLLPVTPADVGLVRPAKAITLTATLTRSNYVLDNLVVAGSGLAALLGLLERVVVLGGSHEEPRHDTHT